MPPEKNIIGAMRGSVLWEADIVSPIDLEREAMRCTAKLSPPRTLLLLLDAHTLVWSIDEGRNWEKRPRNPTAAVWSLKSCNPAPNRLSYCRMTSQKANARNED